MSNRLQFVKYGSSESAEFESTSGVPQGSHLGPTLFLIFINDIANDLGIEVFISLFADDLKIAMKIKSADDAIKLQEAINKLKVWCESNGLQMNLKKCAVLTINRNRTHISTDYYFGAHKFEKVSEFRDLGVLIDSKISFAKHISTITAKATAALGFVKRFCYDITDIRTLKTLYFSLVQSRLHLYGCLFMESTKSKSKAFKSSSQCLH